MVKKYTHEELMKLTIEESFKSIPEHSDKADPLSVNFTDMLSDKKVSKT